MMFDMRSKLEIILVVLSTFALPGCSPSHGRGTQTVPIMTEEYAAEASNAVQVSGFIYTANDRGRAISVIDLSSGWVKTIATQIAPHSVQVSPDGTLLLVVGGSPAGDGLESEGGRRGASFEHGELLLFDTAEMSANGAKRIKIGGDPAYVVIDARGKYAYVTNAMDNNLSVVDLGQRTTIDTISTGKLPNGLRISPEGRELYVANVLSNDVSVIDLVSLVEIARIPVGKAPVQVCFTPNGRRAYVSLRDENGVAVIDTAQRMKIATIAVGRNPMQLSTTPDGHYVYVANQGTGATPDSTVSVIDTSNDSVVSTIENGRGAHGVVVSDTGDRVFIANISGDSVSVIDTAERRVTGIIKVGEGPNGIAFRPDNP